MRKSSTMGSVDEGKIADMVILDNNPLLDIKATQHIYGVFTKGKYFDRNALNQILRNAKEEKIKLDKQRETGK